MIIGFMIETSIGTARMATFYTLLLIGAGFFACVCTPEYACGFDLPILGLIGGMVALLIVNHKTFPKLALMLGGIVIFMLLLITLLMMASASEYNDIFRAFSFY